MTLHKAILATYLGVLVYAGVAFVGAGTLRYWQGWLYLVLAVVGLTISHALMPRGSDLTVRRARDMGLGQPWDKRLLRVLFIVTLLMLLVAGMDSGRFHWSGPLPGWLAVAGAALMVAGQILFALAKRQNAFFSSTVQIQTERGHRVCDTGLYSLVRHPGYLGLLVSLSAFPWVMGSSWSFIPAATAAALLVLRTVLEDRFLQSALVGYRDYAAKTRYKIVPGIF